MMKNQHQIIFSIFKCIVVVNCASSDLRDVLLKIFGAMQVTDPSKSADIIFHIKYSATDSNQIIISREGGSDLSTNDIGEFIFLFEKDMTIELQKIRPDLLFIHSAALEYKGKALLLVAPSGTGKSTTSWAMINSGFNYLSDELAPIDITTMSIHPYQHALCLKAKPPVFELPENTLFTSQTIHVPCDSLHLAELTTIKAVFYLEYAADINEPEIIPINTAESAANLFANSLNILAHGENDSGLGIAIKVASQLNSYKLKSNDLEKTCKEVKLLMNSID